MVLAYRLPSIARLYFTPNALAGWPDGVRYEPREIVRRRRQIRLKKLQQQRAATALSIGTPLLGEPIQLIRE